MTEQLFSFGKSIEMIKSANKIMYRKAWHGVLLGKAMGIIFAGRADLTDIDATASTTLDGIFIFISGEKRYAWTPSQHDMMSNDWVVMELPDFELMIREKKSEKL